VSQTTANITPLVSEMAVGVAPTVVLDALVPFFDSLTETVVCLDGRWRLRHQNPAFKMSWVWPSDVVVAIARTEPATATVELIDHAGNPTDVVLHLVPIVDGMQRIGAYVGRARCPNEPLVDELRQAAALILNRVAELDDRHVLPRGDAELQGRLDMLSNREREILDLVLDGNRVKTVAGTLFLSENTVRNYLKRIYHKLDVHSLGELRERMAPVSSHRSS
jgi:DNA-binding CsgD family transcriptional regulator